MSHRLRSARSPGLQVARLGTLAALTAVVALAGACGDGSDLRTPMPDDPIDAALALLDAPWCEPFAERVCRSAEICGCTASPSWPADCVAYTVAQCRRDLGTAARGMAGDFLVSRDAAPRCLELLDQALATCDVPDDRTFAAECRLLVPSGGDALPRSGEPCTAGGLCGRGLRCAAGSVCRVPRPEGDFCSIDGDCAPPLACHSECTPGAGCAFHCAPRPVPTFGAPCGSTVGRFCEDGSLCQLSLTRHCLPLEDGWCAADHDCADDEFCGYTAHPSCAPLPHVGELCRDTPRCAPGLVCDFTDLRCAEPPGAGDDCLSRQNGGLDCKPGLACVGGRCGPPGKRGEPCSFGAATCASGLGCAIDDAGATSCQPLPPLGAPCSAFESCGPDAQCALPGVCAARAGEGERCSGSDGCRGGLQCAERFPGESFCMVVDGPGDICGDVCPVGLGCGIEPLSSVCVPPMCGLVRL